MLVIQKQRMRTVSLQILIEREEQKHSVLSGTAKPEALQSAFSL